MLADSDTFVQHDTALFKIHFNIILFGLCIFPSKNVGCNFWRTWNGLLWLWLPLIWSPWCNQLETAFWRIQVMKLLVVQFSHLWCYLLSLGTKYSPEQHFNLSKMPNCLNLCSWFLFIEFRFQRSKILQLFSELYCLKNRDASVGTVTWLLVGRP